MKLKKAIAIFLGITLSYPTLPVLEKTKIIAEENNVQRLEKDSIKEMEAEEKAVEGMGEAEDIGKKLNKVHKPKLDWKLLILVIILISFGIVVAFLHNENAINSKIENTIFYVIIGSVLGIAIYFFDYRKKVGEERYKNSIFKMENSC